MVIKLKSNKDVYVSRGTYTSLSFCVNNFIDHKILPFK